MHIPERELENASDELARLDATCALAPGSVSIALRLAAVSSLIQPTRTGFAALVASEADPLHDALVEPSSLAWRDVLASEEKRVRGGARLTTARFAPATRTLDGYADRDRLDAIWRDSGPARSVVHRALDSAAWSPDLAVGEASAALLLCAGGRTDRIRLLPFAAVVADAREGACAAWREGEEDAWATLALRALASRARAARIAARVVIDAPARESERLDALGRAAITARQALAHLREQLAASIPVLAEDLGLSRPAASDALERLVSLGLAREVTGRARDRVFGYEAACVMAASLLDAAS